MALYATPHPELTMQSVVVTVVFTVDVIEGGKRRLAKANEVEVRLWDVWIGGSFEYNPKEGQPKNADGHAVTNDVGMVIFPGCLGWTGILGDRNDYEFTLKHMTTGDTVKDKIFLGRDGWTYKGTGFDYQTGLPYARLRVDLSREGLKHPFLYEYLRPR